MSVADLVVHSEQTLEHIMQAFVLDRSKGELRITDVMTMYLDDEPREPITTEGTFTCASVAVPDFKVPEA